MNPVDEYLGQLSTALRVRGAARRRFVRECRDHLIESAAQIGAEAAVRAFGPARQIASSFDAAVAARRGARSTAITVIAVLAAASSALALLHGAAPDAVAPLWLAGLFFVAAQLAAVSAGLGAIQGLGMRGSGLAAAPGALALLARRNTCALVAAGVTLFAVGAALPGHGSAVSLLAGPVLLGVAAVAVMRAQGLLRQPTSTRQRITRPPADDLANLIRLPLPAVAMPHLLAATTVSAAAAAFVWDRGEQATLGSALAVAGFEATAVLLGFLTLGPALGLRGKATSVPLS